MEHNIVTILIPTSKTDAASIGERRSHSCTCGQLHSSRALTKTEMCPTCAAVRQMHLVRRLFGGAGSIPLCPNLTGAKCSKASMVATIIHATAALQIPNELHTSAPSWGGHSLRRGGVQFLCNAEVGLDRIRTLARQTSTSNSIFKYTDGAHALTSLRVASDAAMADSVSTLRAEVNELRLEISRSLRPSGDNTATSSQSTSVVPSASPAHCPYVRAIRANAPVHIKCPIQIGRTKCGWHWANSQHVQELEQPIYFASESSDRMAPMCSRCRDALSASSESSTDGDGPESSTSGR